MGHNISGVIATEMKKQNKTKKAIDEYHLIIIYKFVQKSKKKKYSWKERSFFRVVGGFYR